MSEIEYPIHQLLEVAKHARDDIRSIECVLLWVAIPLTLLPPIPVTARLTWIRIILITAVVWFALIYFRISCSEPATQIVMDIEKKNPGYDGVGGNAALILMGWIVPFLESVTALCVAGIVRNLINAIQKKNTEQIAATDRHQHHKLEPTTLLPRRR